jgi:cbb3-type cytochrome oxidase maturation protein
VLPLKIIIYLIPISIFLGAIGLVAFLWSFRSGQYQDMDGAAQRVLFDEDDAPDEDPPGDAQRAPQVRPDAPP